MSNELQRKWISVKDDLPYAPVDLDDVWSDQVIINVEYDKKRPNYVSTGSMHMGEWYWWEGRKKISENFVVTHWMPLPVSPNMQKPKKVKYKL